jgi:hypothetical protein
MRNLSLHKLFLLAVSATLFLTSCKDDEYLLTPAPSPNQSFSEGCDSSSAMLARGWSFVNASYPKGPSVWQNGGSPISTVFNAFSPKGAYAGFIAETANSVRTPVAADAAPYTLIAPTAAQGYINDWVISPVVKMKNGDKIVFYTRSQVLNAGAGDSTDWGNRLQVRLNTNNTDKNVGTSKEHWQWLYTNSPNSAFDNPGDFNNVILDINPFVHEWHKAAVGTTTITSVIDGRVITAATNVLAYPVRWARFEATVSGIDGTKEGRFAFRYYVPGGDPNNGYATAVGLDNIEFKSAGY